MDKPELKPCPFCGGEAYMTHLPLSGAYEARCIKCDIGTWPCLDRKSAVEKWNRRYRKWCDK